MIYLAYFVLFLQFVVSGIVIKSFLLTFVQLTKLTAKPVENYWYRVTLELVFSLVFSREPVLSVLFVGTFRKQGIKITMQYYNLK